MVNLLGGCPVAAITSSQCETCKLREEIRAAQEEAERPYWFQKKAHEEQVIFNDGLGTT